MASEDDLLPEVDAGLRLKVTRARTDPRSMTRSPVIRRRRPADDGGFTLVEAVVAMAVFAVVASVTLGLIVATGRVAGGNIRRTAAANLAMRQIEAVRSTSALSIPDGLQTSTRTVGGTLYTIKQNANYLASGATTSVCASSGSSLAYKLVSVTVTWPNMGAIKPIRADTLKAVGVGTDGLDQTNLGTIALLVAGSTGTPQSGVTVTLEPGTVTRVTGDDGCAVFAGQAVGSYTATASMAGYAGVGNTQTASVGSLGVTAATISRGTLMYDTTRSVVVQLDSTAGAHVPDGMPLRLGDTYLPEATYPLCSGTPTAACTSGTPGTVQGLFPEVYAIKVGACTEVTPSLATVDLRPAAADGSTVTVPVGTVTVEVRNAIGTSLAGRTVTATHDSGCTETYTLPATAAGGSGLVLPYGTWTLSTPIAAASVVMVTSVVTVSPTAKTPSVLLTVAA